MPARRKYTPELLARAAAQSRSVADVLRLLGIRISGGSHAHISRQMKRFGIDTSHFTGSVHNRGSKAPSTACPRASVSCSFRPAHGGSPDSG